MLTTLAWRNIWRNKRRTIITIVSIAFAVILASIMRSMQLGSYERMIDNSVRFYTGYVQVHKDGYWDDRTIDNAFPDDGKMVMKIETVDNVEAAVPRLESFALASYGMQTKGAMILGVDPEKEKYLTEVQNKIVAGNMITKDDDQVLIGKGLGEYLNLGIGDTLVLISQGYHGVNAAGKYAVKGLLEFGSPLLTNQIVFMPLGKAQYFFGAEGLLTAIAIVTDHPKHVNAIMSEMSGMIDEEENEVMGWLEMNPELIQGIEIDNVSGIIMLMMLYVVIGFGMFGTFLMMTAERLYEFGVLVSIGMRRIRLQLTVFVEIIMLSLIGVLAGFSLSVPVIAYFYNNPVRLPEEYNDAFEKFGVEPIYVFSIEPVVFTSQVWVVFLMAVVLGAYPLWKIGRLKPVTAMREGR